MQGQSVALLVLQDALSPQWKKLVTRDATGQLASNGHVWAVPYRWGCNLVAYTPSYVCRLA